MKGLPDTIAAIISALDEIVDVDIISTGLYTIGLGTPILNPDTYDPYWPCTLLYDQGDPVRLYFFCDRRGHRAAYDIYNQEHLVQLLEDAARYSKWSDDAT